MVKWTKVHSESEHKELIKIWGNANVDSIEFHQKFNKLYPYWFTNNNKRQPDNGYIKENYPDKIVLFKTFINPSQLEIILW